MISRFTEGQKETELRYIQLEEKRMKMEIDMEKARMEMEERRREAERQHEINLWNIFDKF